MGVARIFSGGGHFSKILKKYIMKIAKKRIILAYEILRKFSKNFLIKSRKCIISAYFSKKTNKPRVKFLRVWTKNGNCWEILRTFSNIFLRKWQKLHYFGIFSKKLTNQR